MNDEQTQDVVTPTEEVKTPEILTSDVSIQPNASTPTDLPPEAPESPTIDVAHSCPIKLEVAAFG